MDPDRRHAAPLGAAGACDAVPQAGDLGLPYAHIITPGDPGRSVLPAPMNRRDADAMPPLASHAIDADGVALASAWIDALTACP